MSQYLDTYDRIIEQFGLSFRLVTENCEIDQRRCEKTLVIKDLTTAKGSLKSAFWTKNYCSRVLQY